MRFILRKLVYIFGVFLLGLSSVAVMAQGDFILDRFDALAFDGQVRLTCVISSGNTCNGINVYRSTDNGTFELIGDIPGICGSTNAPVTYDYIDEQPVINQISYYKLELGGVGFTDPISVTLRDLQEDQVRIQPNPANSFTTIYFSNTAFLSYALNVLSNKGESVIALTTKEDFFTIDVSFLPTGIYPIMITEETTGTRRFSLMVVQR